MTVVEFNHYSVMLHETIEQLNINPDGIYVDGTLGGGGHAYEVCSRLKTDISTALIRMMQQSQQHPQDCSRLEIK